MRKAFSNISSGLVGALVLSYVLFMGYVLTVAQQANATPTRIATAACFSWGRCQMSTAAND